MLTVPFHTHPRTRSMHYSQALSRLPSATCAQGLTTSELGVPDAKITRQQFDAYISTLLGLRLTVTVLPEEAAFPDSHFVEDTAVVGPEFAVLTHPGAPSRRGETATIEPVLGRHRTVTRMTANAHMDGGDVLMVDKRFFVGLTSRTDEAGVREFAAVVEPFGYRVDSIQVSDGLHLKSIVNYVGRNTLILNEEGARNPAFSGFRHLILDRQEEYAGNTLWINDTLITPSGYPDTLAKLKTVGLPILQLDTSEIKKMDGGLTCLSLRF
jgi:dimethylargininase